MRIKLQNTNAFFSSSLSRSRIEKVNYRQKEKQVLDAILGKGYDKRIRPSGRNDTGTDRQNDPEINQFYSYSENRSTEFLFKFFL